MDRAALQLFRDECGDAPLPVRGVGWVLQWAAALAVLLISAMFLVAFGHQLAAEHALRRAAAAGLREAALPRSTSASVRAVVRQQLAGQPDLLRATTMRLEQNGSPIQSPTQVVQEKQLAMILSAANTAALPRWLRCLDSGTEIRVRLGQTSRIQESNQPQIFANGG
jgi:hypothetical protein